MKSLAVKRTLIKRRSVSKEPPEEWDTESEKAERVMQLFCWMGHFSCSSHPSPGLGTRCYSLFRTDDLEKKQVALPR